MLKLIIVINDAVMEESKEDLFEAIKSNASITSLNMDISKLKIHKNKLSELPCSSPSLLTFSISIVQF